MGNIDGSLSGCCSCESDYDKEMINFAIARTSSSLNAFLKQHSFKLHHIISNNAQFNDNIDNFHVKFIPKTPPTLPISFHREVQEDVEKVYLTNHYELRIIDTTQKPYTKQQGVIISPHAFFQGEFEGENMHGQGSFYFLDWDRQSIKKTVKGQWKQNFPQELKFYNESAVWPILSITFINGERQAKLTLPDRTTYLGSIKLAMASSVADIMTGRGVINFPNKDIYIGGVKEGKMHTADHGVACFISKDSKTSYKGHYVKGLREGVGCLSFEHEREPITIECMWQNGKRVGSFEILQKGKNQDIEWPLKPVIRRRKKSQIKHFTTTP